MSNVDEARTELLKQVNMVKQLLEKMQIELSGILNSLIPSISQDSSETPLKKESEPETNQKPDPLSSIVDNLDKGRNNWFYSVSLGFLVIALCLILSFLFGLPLPQNVSTETENALKTFLNAKSQPNVADSLQKSVNLTQREQIVEALKILDHANTAQAIIIGAKILTALTLGIVLIVALSRIITTRYRTIATLYGIAKKK